MSPSNSPTIDKIVEELLNVAKQEKVKCTECNHFDDYQAYCSSLDRLLRDDEINTRMECEDYDAK